MSKICKLLVVSLATCLFITTVGISKEDTSRKKMPKWNIEYWGNDKIGLTYEEIHGRFGVVYLKVLSTKGIDPATGEFKESVLSFWKGIQKHMQEKYLDHGLYFQLLTCKLPYNPSYGSKVGLLKLTKRLGITLPVASLRGVELWDKCQLYKAGDETYFSGAFLIDPYGRIAGRTAENKTQKLRQLEILPYRQMRREMAEYWLDTKAKDIARADKLFKKKKKWKDAYLIYKPLAEKVKAVEAGNVIAERVDQIENEVRNTILKILMNVTSENISKSMAPMKKTMREFKGTLLAAETSRQLAVLKRAKKDAELLDLIRLNVANTFTRLDRKEEAKVIYESLAGQYKEDENYQAELSLRIAGKFQLTKKQALDLSCSVEEWLEKAEGFFTEAEKLLVGKNINREGATAFLLAAAEHYTAVITNSEKELPGTRGQLKAARTKLFWIASQE
ncbi:hypothetical protein ACFL54_08130 [Planctomycetota bacterium]